MSNPQQETKIELVTEAIEAVVLANVTYATNTSSNARKANYQNVLDARSNLSSALRELLQPVLRIVTTERIDKVGDISTTLSRTEITGAREIVEYPGGIDDMNIG